MNLKRLLVISIRQLLGDVLFMPTEWSHFSKRAYFEPIVIRDGFHDFVLMGAPDYDAMQKAYAKTQKDEAPIGSPDLAILVPALAEMAKIGTRRCPECNGGGCHKSRMGEIEGACTECGGSGEIPNNPTNRR